MNGCQKNIAWLSIYIGDQGYVFNTGLFHAYPYANYSVKSINGSFTKKYSKDPQMVDFF